MAQITLRSGRTTPLTIAEVDSNFTNLNTAKLETSEFTGTSILTRLITVDGVGSGLDADLLDGLNSSSAATPSTIVARDSVGNFAASTISANLIGNVTGNADTATLATATINGVVTTASYANPTWIASLSGSKLLSNSVSNSSLINSSITIDGNTVSLGGSISITGANLNWTGTQTFQDDRFFIAEGTKQVAFDCVSISANATRTLTIPNANGTIATQEYVQTTGRNSQGNKTVQPLSSGVPANTVGSNGDIIYQY